MSQPEYTTPDQLTLQSLDFHDYEDPALESLHTWQQAGTAWQSKVMYVAHFATMNRNVPEAEAELIAAEQRYSHAFITTVDTFTSDSPSEEQAVQAITQLIQDEHLRTRQLLLRWYDMSHLPKAADTYARSLALHIRDPHGLVLPRTQEHYFSGLMSPEQLFTEELRRQSDIILGAVRHAHEARILADLEPKRRSIARSVLALFRNRDK